MLETQGRMRFASFDALAQGVAVISESGQLLCWNRWLELWTGVPRADALSRPLAESAPELAELLAESIARALQGESAPPLRWEPEPAAQAQASTATPKAVLRLRAEPLAAYDLLRCAVITVEDLGEAAAPVDARPEFAAREAELIALRARVAAQDVQLRRQTDALLRYAREFSVATAAVDDALVRCEVEPPGALEKERAAQEPAQVAQVAQAPTPRSEAAGEASSEPRRSWADAL